MNRPLNLQNRVWRPLIASTRVLILGLLLTFAVAACASFPTPTPTPQPIEKAIVGKWVNPQGGEVNFYADNTGFIPGLKGEPEDIPDSKFTYYFQDKTHLGIALEGQTSVVMEIKIEGDKMTWRSRTSNTEFVYTRAK
ncbi:MAG: hypothetical protein NT169_15735 [Chloroflexi bacterium]|nr:hypothetical protein [Chloroflexota bacterium]